jgi:hypothetical protein
VGAIGDSGERERERFLAVFLLVLFLVTEGTPSSFCMATALSRQVPPAVEVDEEDEVGEWTNARQGKGVPWRRSWLSCVRIWTKI